MKTPLPAILESKLADFRRRVWLVKLAEGLLAALFSIALSWVLVFGLDRFIETPAFLRAAILAAGAAVLGLGLPLKWHRWVWRQRRLEDAARLLRRTFPRLGDQLLGIVELARLDSGSSGRSERLVQAAMEQAAASVQSRDFREAVPEAKHRRWAWSVAGALALVGIAVAVVPDASRNALARWLTPWADVERFTFARVKPLPERLVVPYAEPFDLPVRLADDTRWSPRGAKARIGAQPGIAARLDPADGAYPLAFPPQTQSATLKLSLGDARASLRLDPLPRPELTNLSVRLRLPAYLDYKTEPILEVRGGAIRVLKGAQASFQATASRALAAAEMDGSPQEVRGEELTTAFLPIEENTETSLTWKDREGLAPREPLLLKIHAAEDDAPRIVARRDSPEQVVLDSEIVAFDVNVEDDFGVRQVGLEWRGVAAGAAGPRERGDPAAGDKIAAAGAPEKKALEARATFCAAREGVAPQSLEIRAWADDYLPGRKRSYSAAFVLHVLSKTDHALWLTEQFGKWLQVARESYEREQQLHATNRELRALGAADLDRPENRRRVAQQAAAENANAARLDHLVHAGRRLVDQATRNDEFDVTRLESWATLLQSLQDIAANRMPGVEDLLRKTAAAPGHKPAGSPSAQPPASMPAAGPRTSGAPPSPPPSATAQPGAPQIAQGDLPPPGAAAPVDPFAAPKPPAPSIADREPGFGTPPPAEADPGAGPRPPAGGALTLPVTTLGAAPGAKKDEISPSPPESPAQENLEDAVVAQRDLLAAFAAVSDELAEILASLEASTFVKRFKAASRQQLLIAGDINRKTMNAFGLYDKPVADAASIADRAAAQSEVVHVIQNDLGAFYQRRPDLHFRNILDQMRQTEIVRSLATVGEHTQDNLSGYGLVGAEFWADTMDRWAEEMVAASECKSCSSCSSDSLPPEIVLKVMQALRDEMKLRDETREMENARPALEEKVYARRTVPLAESQERIRRHTASAMDDILALPQGGEKFGRELRLLDAVTGVMAEARDILDQPDTGDAAIAAETEAIELLLQSRRQNPRGGGGGGSNPGGGGTGMATQAALAGLGPGSDADARVATRPVGQATGKAGREFPEEFKTGLDAYFNALETRGTAR